MQYLLGRRGTRMMSYSMHCQVRRKDTRWMGYTVQYPLGRWGTRVMRHTKHYQVRRKDTR
jgi:hypothetical protein